MNGTTDLHELSGAYAVDALDGRERERYEAHLARCAPCRAEVDDLQAAVARIGAVAEEAPPPSLRADLLGLIDTTRQERPGPAAVESRRWRPTGDGRHRWAAAAAAALVVVAVGTGVTLARSASDPVDGPTEVVLAARDAAMVPLTGPEGVTANFHYAVSEGRGVLSAQGLEPLDDGRVYELWILREDALEPAGLFQPDADGRATAVVAGRFDDAAGVAVSVEPEGGMPAPTGPVVLEGTIPAPDGEG